MTETLVVEGYAAVFGMPDLSGDVIVPGAFRDGLRQKLIPGAPGCVMMLYQHAVQTPIGRWTDLREDGPGLYVRGELDGETVAGRDAAILVTKRIVDGLSIGFKPRRSRRRPAGGRELIEIDLWEVSIVTFPMAPGARIRSFRPAARPPRNLLAS